MIISTVLVVDVFAGTTLNVPYFSQIDSKFYDMKTNGCYLTALTMAVDYVYNVNLTPDDIYIGNGYSSYVLGEETIIRRFVNMTGKKIKADIESSPEIKFTQWNYWHHKIAIEVLKVPVVLYYRWKPGDNLHSHAIVLVGTTGKDTLNSYYPLDEQFYLKREEQFLVD